MIRVALCIGQLHDPRLLLVAIFVCMIGSLATVQLLTRIRQSSGRTKAGWVALTSVAMGSMVWSTHFIAMIAYRADVPVMLDPVLTLLSLVVAIGAAIPGLAIAVHGQGRRAPIGGALVGLSIAAMHFTGMAALRVDGLVQWDGRFVVASVLLATMLGALAFRTCAVTTSRGRRAASALLLGGAVAGLHFTGMAAMTIVPMGLHGGGLGSLTMTVLAASTAFASLLVIGCAAVSALIDSHTQQEAFARLRRMALRDGLTELPNRGSFNTELMQQLQHSARGRSTAVVMLDLSGFKGVNDAYGHQAGDQLLIALAARFTAMLQPGEYVGRLGGDEFAAVVTYAEASELDYFLRRLTGAFVAPFQFSRFTAFCGANFGVALAPRDGNDADTLLANADLAMYRAKLAHSPVPCFYEPAMDEAVRERRDLATDLRAAIGTDQFQVHYQVQASIGASEISGFEALLRWSHPIRGAIPPPVFIPLAEEVGEIAPLGAWVLDRVCAEAAAWPQPHLVAVNLSPLQLADPLLISTVAHALATSGLDPARLELELTESAIIRDRDHAYRQLRALKQMGITVALDDFGVGYSSLDVLRSFPFDRIKLDRSFVSEVEESEQAVAILHSIAALGRKLGIPVLAEGIETAAQLDIVAREGCSNVQGYLLGRPARALADAGALRQAMRTLAGPADPFELAA